MATALLGSMPSAFASSTAMEAERGQDRQHKSTTRDIGAYDDWYDERPMHQASRRKQQNFDIDLTTSIRAQQVWEDCKNAARKQAILRDI